MAATRKVSFGPNPEKVQTEYDASCKDCGPDAVVIEDHQSGDLICQRCGVVIGEHIIDTDREWREFESDSGSQQRSRVGAAGDILLEDAGLTTSIGGTDALSKSLARTQMRGQKSEQKSIIEGFKRIEEFAGKMELPERQKFRAKELFKQMEEHKATRGRNSEALIAACIYMACRLENVPRTLKEFVVITGVQKKDIGKAYKHILSVLKVNMTHVSADDYMTRFCNHLDLPVSVRNAAEQVAKKASEMGIVAGKTPTTIAAAAIFLVSQLTENDKKAQKDIFEATGVSEATIRNCFKDMEPHRKELLGTYIKQFPVN